MASLENQQQAFPAVPPSFSAGGHEMRDYYADSSAPRPFLNQDPYLTPYLGLRARLSQVWINRWTILLLLVLARILLAISNANDLINDAQTEALSACTVVEKMGSTLASVPHYASQGFNSMAATGVTKAVQGLQSMVMLSLTGVEEIIVFYIGMLTNTYLCLITLAVSGSLHAVVDVLASAQTSINSTLSGIAGDIGTTASNLEKSLQSLVAGINTVFGANNPPTIDFTSQINALKSYTLPSNLDADIVKLNSSIPTFEDVKNATDSVIRLPFEQVKSLINSTWSNYTFNHSLLPVPQKEELSFCSDNNNINNFFNDLRKIAHTARNVFLGVLLTLAMLACIPMAALEIRRFLRLQVRSKLVHHFTSGPMDTAYLFARPYTSDFGRWASRRYRNPRTQVLVRWCIAYCTSLPALVLLSLALAGLFSCLLQLIFLKAIEKEVPTLTAEVAGFVGDIVNKLNNASASWANSTNAVIVSESGKLNHDLLGWVNTSTTAVNDTLNKFVDETVSVLNTTFGGTPLAAPIQEVFNCLIGLKVAGIEQGLTWVHDNAHIDFPMLPGDTLTGGLLSKASPEVQTFFSNPQSVTSDDVSAAVNKVGAKIEKGIKQEAIISTMLLVAYLVVFFSGLIVTLIRLKQHDKLRGEAGNNYNVQDFGNNFGANLGNTPMSSTKEADFPLGPAPAYTTASHDVNVNAPYTLNAHPIPRSTSEDDYSIDKHASLTISNAWPSNSQNQTTYQNEKSGGFI
jgi:hypothetical protein